VDLNVCAVAYRGLFRSGISHILIAIKYIASINIVLPSVIGILTHHLIGNGSTINAVSHFLNPYQGGLFPHQAQSARKQDLVRIGRYLTLA